MARKRKVRPEMVEKPTPQQLGEWESILKKHGLTMGRGNRNWLTYLGTAGDLEALNGAIQERNGRGKTK